MMDMTPTLAPKSDQLNADDLIAGPRVIVITKVTAGNANQPVAVHFEGDDGRPFYPCKSMRRVMVAAWGADASTYRGRAIELYLDPEVMYGGIKVGGIRIARLSHIDSPMKIALTVTRAKRAMYSVKPLQAATAAHEPGYPSSDLQFEVLRRLTDLGVTTEGIAVVVAKAGGTPGKGLGTVPDASLSKLLTGTITPEKVDDWNSEGARAAEAAADVPLHHLPTAEPVATTASRGRQRSAAA